MWFVELLYFSGLQSLNLYQPETEKAWELYLHWKENFGEFQNTLHFIPREASM